MRRNCPNCNSVCEENICENCGFSFSDSDAGDLVISGTVSDSPETDDVTNLVSADEESNLLVSHEEPNLLFPSKDTFSDPADGGAEPTAEKEQDNRCDSESSAEGVIIQGNKTKDYNHHNSLNQHHEPSKNKKSGNEKNGNDAENKQFQPQPESLRARFLHHLTLFEKITGAVIIVWLAFFLFPSLFKITDEGNRSEYSLDHEYGIQTEDDRENKTGTGKEPETEKRSEKKAETEKQPETERKTEKQPGKEAETEKQPEKNVETENQPQKEAKAGTNSSTALTIQETICEVSVTGGSGSGFYRYGELATIEADTLEGYVFDGWDTGDPDLTVDADSRELVITVTNDLRLKAKFKESEDWYIGEDFKTKVTALAPVLQAAGYECDQTKVSVLNAIRKYQGERGVQENTKLSKADFDELERALTVKDNHSEAGSVQSAITEKPAEEKETTKQEETQPAETQPVETQPAVIDAAAFVGGDYRILLEAAEDLKITKQGTDEIKIGSSDGTISVTALTDGTICRVAIHRGSSGYAAEGIYTGIGSAEAERIAAENGYEKTGWKREEDDPDEIWIINSNIRNRRFLTYRVRDGRVTSIYYGLDGFMPLKDYQRFTTETDPQVSGLAPAGSVSERNRTDLADYVGGDCKALQDDLFLQEILRSMDGIKIGNDDVSITADPGGTVTRVRLHEGDPSYCVEGIYPGLTAVQAESIVNDHGYSRVGCKIDESADGEKWIICMNREKGRFIAYRAGDSQINAVYYGLNGYLPFSDYVHE